MLRTRIAPALEEELSGSQTCGVGAVLSLMLGLFLFPIHFPSGALYFSLLTFTPGSCAAFALAATARYMWFRTQQRSGPD
jgi:hypothetical protein